MNKQIALLTTTRCNFQCKHCLRGAPSTHFDAPLDVLEKSFIDAKAMGFEHIGFTGGEPIMHPKFDALVHMVTGLGYTWSVTSNGSFAREYGEIIHKFKDKLKIARLSLDGGKAQTHDFIRQQGSFDQVMRSSRFYQDLGAKLFWSFGLNAISIHEFDDFLELAENMGVDGITIGAIIPTPFNQELKLRWVEKVRFYNRLNRIKDDLPFKIMTANCLFSLSDADNFCTNLSDHKPAINAKGEYIFCCDNVGNGGVLGSLRDTSFNDLYQKGIQTGKWLMEKRKEMIERNQFFEDFNSCVFCNTLLKDTFGPHDLELLADETTH